MIFIAVDGGGKGCRIAAFTPDGHVLAFEKGGPLNPNSSGLNTALDNLKSTANRLSSAIGKQPVQAIFAGISGVISAQAVPAFQAILSDIFIGCENIMVHSDGVSALASGVGANDGSVLISGTGVVGFIKEQGLIRQMSGLGYLLDKGGSGWHVGRDGISAVLMQYDGRGPKTAIKEPLEQALGMSVKDALPLIYRGELFPANYANIVLDVAAKGDEVAINIANDNATHLAHLALALSRKNDGFGNVVLSGGLLENKSGLFPYFEHCVCKDIPLISPLGPPLLGDAFLALDLLGITPSDHFAQCFNNGSFSL